MVHALPAHAGTRIPLLQRVRELHPDGIRIAALSATLALNLAVLLALLLPTNLPTASAPPIDEPDPILPDRPQPVIPIPPPPRPEVVRPAPTVVQPVRPTPATPPIETSPVVDGTDVAPPLPDIVAVPAPSYDTAPARVGLAAIDAPAPPYPISELRRGVEGTVLLEILVDGQGLPIEVTIKQSSGHRRLDAAARKHVLAHWRFRPAMRDGMAVRAIGLLPIVYKLR